MCDVVFFFKQKTAYKIEYGLVGSEMCIRDSDAGERLRAGPVPVTEIRAGIIVGPGSAAYEVMRDLVNHLPLMLTPKWVRSRSTPIALDNLLEYLLRQSGGLLDVTKTASAVGISRPTVESHLQALQITQAVTLLRPFHSGHQKEITRMPRLYGFDTGFVSQARGWNPLRPDDGGFLWEHLVLEHLQAYLPDLHLHYWRDKTGREVDFVIVRDRDQVDAIECKWDASEFDPAGLKAFRALYPKGCLLYTSDAAAERPR